MAKIRSRQLVAVVTGANRGIGLELVRQLAQLRLISRPLLQPDYRIDSDDDDDDAHDEEYEEEEEEEEGIRYSEAAGGRAGEEGDDGLYNYFKMEVVLTARNPELGREAVASLSASNHGDHHHSNVHFHQLDVTCRRSVSAFASWLRLRFGRLDLLINNAGVLGATWDLGYFQAHKITTQVFQKSVLHQVKALKVDALQQRNCIETNYFGVKRMIEAMLPLLSKSKFGGRIINVSSSAGKLENLPNKKLWEKISQIDTLNEKDVDDFVGKFLKDLDTGLLHDPTKTNGNPTFSWPLVNPAYRVSKIAINAYTRVLARDLPKKGYCEITINVVHPGFVKTDMVNNMGELSTTDGAKDILWLAMLPHPHPSGCCFFRQKPYDF